MAVKNEMQIGIVLPLFRCQFFFFFFIFNRAIIHWDISRLFQGKKDEINHKLCLKAKIKVKKQTKKKREDKKKSMI